MRYSSQEEGLGHTMGQRWGAPRSGGEGEEGTVSSSLYCDFQGRKKWHRVCSVGIWLVSDNPRGLGHIEAAVTSLGRCSSYFLRASFHPAH